MEFISMVKNHRFQKYWFYQNLLFIMRTENVIRKSFFFTEKNKDLPTINQKLVEINHLIVVHININLAKDIDL